MTDEPIVRQAIKRIAGDSLDALISWDDAALFLGTSGERYRIVFSEYLQDDASITKRDLIHGLADCALGEKRSVELLRKLNITGINQALSLLEDKPAPEQDGLAQKCSALFRLQEDAGKSSEQHAQRFVDEVLSTEEIMRVCGYKSPSQIISLRHRYPEIIKGNEINVGNLIRIYLQAGIKRERKEEVLLALGYESLAAAASAIGIDNPYLEPTMKERRTSRTSEESLSESFTAKESPEPVRLPQEIADKYPSGVPLDVLVNAVGSDFLSYNFFIVDKNRGENVKLIPDRGTWRLTLSRGFFSCVDIIGNNVTGAQLAGLFKEYDPYKPIYEQLAAAKQKR